jgi:hypothetical protein
LNVIPVRVPPDPVTHYFGEKLLFFPQGLLLDSIADNGTFHSFLVNGSSNVTASLSIKHAQSGFPSSPPLVIGYDQQLLIGAGTSFYTYVRLHRSLKLICRPRYLPDSNLPPVPPPLPYEVPLQVTSRQCPRLLGAAFPRNPTFKYPPRRACFELPYLLRAPNDAMKAGIADRFD